MNMLKEIFISKTNSKVKYIKPTLFSYQPNTRIFSFKFCVLHILQFAFHVFYVLHIFYSFTFCASCILHFTHILHCAFCIYIQGVPKLIIDLVGGERE